MELVHGYTVSVKENQEGLSRTSVIVSEDPPIVYTPIHRIDSEEGYTKLVDFSDEKIRTEVIPKLIERYRDDYDGDGVPIRILLDYLVEGYGLSEDEAYSKFSRTGYGMTPYERLQNGRIILTEK